GVSHELPAAPSDPRPAVDGGGRRRLVGPARARAPPASAAADLPLRAGALLGRTAAGSAEGRGAEPGRMALPTCLEDRASRAVEPDSSVGPRARLPGFAWGGSADRRAPAHGRIRRRPRDYGPRLLR